MTPVERLRAAIGELERPNRGNPMTAIRKAAEERHPDEPDKEFVGDGNQSDARCAFIAGAEWMREEAARVVADWSWRISLEPICQDCSYTASEALAAAIRKIGEGDD